MFLATARGQVLDKLEHLKAQTFWDNRDFDWYASNIPFFECPDKEITTTYYYRWDLLTKHLTYGSPNSGYSFTEFIDRPFWSGAYGAISCPAGHQLYEARWLRSPRVAKDYGRYWLRTPGAQPRNYSTWLADSIWASHQVHPDDANLIDLLPDLVKNYEGWEQRHYVREVGLFWQTGHDDGMEFNINSRQTQDILRGAPSYRPSFNAYMFADAMAIARIAQLAGQREVANRFRGKAESIKAKMLELMWDEKRKFFFPLLKNDERSEGHEMKALTRTYESGQYAGDSHGRELIGYVPWQFGVITGPSKYDEAWKKLTNRDGFFADFGPSTVERNDPMFLLKSSCCWWSGQSWPYATTQTLKGLANALQSGMRTLSNDDYLQQLAIYARSHRKGGQPYLAEALHPDTESFDGHDGYNHSEHYFHSGFCDLIMTGLVGIVPRDDDTLEVHPLAPHDWDYFALEDLPYRGHLVSVFWDKTGQRYPFGRGMHLLVDGRVVSQSPTLERVQVPGAAPPVKSNGPVNQTLTNYVVNNDGTYYPRLTASYTSANSALGKLNDGNYWYLLHPPNRWTTEGSPNTEDWIEIDFGTSRQINSLKLYILDDTGIADSKVRAPAAIRLESRTGDQWQPVACRTTPSLIEGHRPVTLSFESMEIRQLRISLVHAAGARSGLTEIEAWGQTQLPLERLPHPPGNLAYNDGSQEYPIASASFHDVYGGLPRHAIDGITNFLPSPMNRWTSYGSGNKEDWLEIDFGKRIEMRRIDMAIYDDRGGVQPPTSYKVQVWQDDTWRDVASPVRSPHKPAGSQWNSISFDPTQATKLRIVFENQGQARSGVSEVMVWNE